MFNHKRMLAKATRCLRAFALRHQHETFYAFAIDANFLCLNSVEQFAATLQEYQHKWGTYKSDPMAIEELKYNPADWGYTKFGVLRWWNGFDGEKYQVHYEKHLKLDSNRKLPTDYRQEMNKLIAALEQVNAFAQFKRTDDFRAFLAEHIY